VLAAERRALFGIPGDDRVGKSLADLLRPLQGLAESGVHDYAFAAVGSVWYFRRKRSTRPAVSTRRCLPVK
jgi:hypothetical protein